MTAKSIPAPNLLERYIKTQLTRNLSPLRYPGGKRVFAPFLKQAIISNSLHGCRYLEPYAGGAGAALELLRSGCVSDIVINDKDPAIYWFWKAAVEESERFIDRIERADITVTEWLIHRETLRSRNRGFDLGFAAFFLNRTCISGIIKRCGGLIGGFDQKGKYKIDCRFHKPTLIAKIKFLGDNRSRIKVHNLDAIACLKKYGRDRNSFVFYLDPPYYHKASELYLNAYTHKDHEELRDFLLGDFHDHNWILSYDQCPEISELYRSHSYAEIMNYHSLANKPGTKEFITSSDRIQLPS